MVNSLWHINFFYFFLTTLVVIACAKNNPPATPTKFTGSQIENERKLREADLAKARAFQVDEEKSSRATYVVELVKVDVSTKENGLIENASVFKTKEVEFSWEPSQNSFVFSLANNTDKTLKIVWDNVVFIDSLGESHKVIHSGVKLVDRNSSQPPTLVVKGSHVRDSIQPADYIHWHKGYTSLPGQWEEKSILPDSIYGSNSDRAFFQELVSTQIGKKLKVMVTLEFLENVKEYLFEFEIKSANVKS